MGSRFISISLSCFRSSSFLCRCSAYRNGLSGDRGKVRQAREELDSGVVGRCGVGEKMVDMD